MMMLRPRNYDPQRAPLGIVKLFHTLCFIASLGIVNWFCFLRPAPTAYSYYHIKFSIVPDSQLKRCMKFEIGFNFRNDPRGIGEVVPRSDQQNNAVKIATGKNTAKLFLFAMETSGSGPPPGIMTLDDHQGAAAFLRAVKNQLSLDNTFCDGYQTISDYLTTKGDVPNDIATGKTWEQTVSKEIKPEQGFGICKVPSVNPLLLFLHLDQGCFANTGYTPFASPVTNSRSIYQDHVQNIYKEVKNGTGEITQEDIALIPFDVCLDERQGESASIPYMCALNRDKQSNANVMGKKAVSSTKETLDILNQKASSYNPTMILCLWIMKIYLIRTFFMQQLLGRGMKQGDESKKEAVLVGEYLARLHLWLNAYFGGLQKTENWELFYVHLVRVVVELANARSTHQDDPIDVNNVVMPRVNDLFQACRLMIQAIGSLRIAISDGQHRMAVIMNLLSCWTIKFISSDNPPQAFVRVEDHTDDVKARVDFTKLLTKLASGRVTVRILQTNTSQLEVDGIAYSLVREVSQSHHQARGLRDM